MFVGMTIRESEIREDDVKKTVKTTVKPTNDYYVDTDKIAMEILGDMATYNKTKNAVMSDIKSFEWPKKGENKGAVKIRREKKKPASTSWADMCETSDEEDEEVEVEEDTEKTTEDGLGTEGENENVQEPSSVKDDEFHYGESKTTESLEMKNVCEKRETIEQEEEREYQMDKTSQSSEWMWDEQVFEIGRASCRERV